MDHFDYKLCQMHVEEVSLARIASQVGTPFYAYSTATLTRHYQVLAEGLKGLNARICFAMKSNPNLAVARTFADLGAGADVVSEGEIRLALAAGVLPQHIVFSGVGKTRRELVFALESGIGQFNVESEPELQALNDEADARGMRAPIAIRVNPDVDAGTHAKITTGKKENKFGIEWTRAHEVYRRAMSLPGIEVVGLAVHIGSQLTELDPFRDAFIRVRDLLAILRKDGVPIKRLDLGGGLGIPYEADAVVPSPAQYGALVRETLGDLGCELIFEPGRLLVGNAGVLASRVVYVKEGATRSFVIVDAAMNDLMRPALYEAYHAIIPASQPAADVPLSDVDIVGPICESGDTFAKQRSMPPVKAGDLLVFRTAGAYGAAMSSEYNSRLRVPEVMVKGGDFAVVRSRGTYEELIDRYTLPPWLEGR